MSGKGPGLFSAIGKIGRDILMKDYNSDQRFTFSSSSTNSGLDLKSTLVKSRGLSSGDVAAAFKYKNKAVNVKVDTESNVLTTFTVSDVVPSVKTIALIRLPDYNSGKVLRLSWDKRYTPLGLNRSPAIDFSGMMGTPSIVIGAQISFSTRMGKFTKYKGCVGKFMFWYIIVYFSFLRGDKGDSMKVSYLYQLERLNGGAVVGEISRRFSTNENTLTVGCLYVVDSQTALKAKLNNHGNLGALLQHELTRKSFLTISSAFETKDLDKSPKFGFTLLLKP
ncbi:Mitochondrial outer membrane protein porin 5 [Glycine soja]|nr:Mitochondrial outer membrane protein porin 5 [Glycine soja]